MNVLIIAQYFPPDMGGASTRVFNVAKGLVRLGCSVNVIAAFPHYPEGNIPDYYRGKALTFEKNGDIHVSRVWVPSLAHDSISNRIILHLCFLFSSLFMLPFKGNFDVIWAANPNLFSFISALIYSFVRQKPIIRNVDDLWPEVFYDMGLVKSTVLKKILDFLAWLSYTVPEAITPISAGYKGWITEKYGVSAEKIHVVEVGLKSVNPLQAEGNSNEKEEFRVMYSGVLGLGYDFDIVFDAARLLKENEQITFVIRGIGESVSNLQRQVKNRTLENVVLDTTFLPEDELVALLGSADVFLLPMATMSFVDLGLPTKVFEYQSYGKPIICVSGGEPARYVRETMSGIVISPRDYEALAKAVLYLKENRAVAESLGASGRRYVESNMSIEKIGLKMMTAFGYVLRKSFEIHRTEQQAA